MFLFCYQYECDILGKISSNKTVPEIIKIGTGNALNVTQKY